MANTNAPEPSAFPHALHMIQLLRTHFSDTPLPNDLLAAFAAYTDHDWQQFRRECLAQGVLLMAADQLGANGLPAPGSEAETALQDTALQLILHNEAVRYEQAALLQSLENSGVEAVILKGTAAAAYYPDPTLRALGDIDLLIAPEMRAAAGTMLQNAGYRRISGNNEKYHDAYERNDICAEIHFCVSGIPDGTSGDLLRIHLGEVFRKKRLFSESNAFAGTPDDTDSFPMPSAEDQALILLLHMQKHLCSDGLGMRHLQDWAFFLKNEPACPLTTLTPFLKQIGLFHFASAVTAVCEAVLGLPTQEWRASVSDALCRDLTADCFSGGEFGRKTAGKAESGKVLASAQNGGIRRFVALGQSFIRDRHPAVFRHPILYAVYMPEALAVRIYRVATGKRTPFPRLNQMADEREMFVARLKLFVTGTDKTNK